VTDFTFPAGEGGLSLLRSFFLSLSLSLSLSAFFFFFFLFFFRAGKVRENRESALKVLKVARAPDMHRVSFIVTRDTAGFSFRLNAVSHSPISLISIASVPLPAPPL